MEDIPQQEPLEVAFLKSALQAAIKQGASHVHIEQMEDEVRNFSEALKEQRGIRTHASLLSVDISLALV